MRFRKYQGLGEFDVTYIACLARCSTAGTLYSPRRRVRETSFVLILHPLHAFPPSVHAGPRLRENTPTCHCKAISCRFVPLWLPSEDGIYTKVDILSYPLSARTVPGRHCCTEEVKIALCMWVIFSASQLRIKTRRIQPIINYDVLCRSAHIQQKPEPRFP